MPYTLMYKPFTSYNMRYIVNNRAMYIELLTQIPDARQSVVSIGGLVESKVANWL
jgi:hypothetical protein